MHELETRRAPAGKAGAWITALLAIALPVTLGAAEPGANAKMELGRKVFTQVAQPPCGLCHTLADAGATGTIGAKLEELKPDLQRILIALRQGSGVMPSYKDKLTEQQIEALAYYVSQAVQKSK